MSILRRLLQSEKRTHTNTSPSVDGSDRKAPFEYQFTNRDSKEAVSNYGHNNHHPLFFKSLTNNTSQQEADIDREKPIEPSTTRLTSHVNINRTGLSDSKLEPENLSTKPEDLNCKTLVLSPAFISVKNGPSTYSKINNHSNLNHFLVKSGGGRLEPLNLSTSVNQHYNTSATPPFPRAVPAQYPPHYIPLNYVHSLQSNLLSSPYYYSSPSPPHLPQAPLSPYPTHCERKNSPLEHAFTPFHIHHSGSMRSTSTALPYYPTSSESRPARDPQPGEPSPLSPSATSSTSSFPFFPDRSPPFLCPKDLSSPGGVSSKSSSGGGSQERNKMEIRCKYCYNSYSSWQEVKKHEDIHLVNKKMTCHICSKVFSRSDYLRAHMAVHEGTQPFSCNQCEKRFTFRNNLIRHKLIHSGEKPHKCEMCGQKFTRKDTMMEHVRTHTSTGEKPFMCTHCGTKFVHRKSLARHTAEFHTNRKNYKCHDCGKDFFRKDYLSTHIATHLKSIKEKV